MASVELYKPYPHQRVVHDAITEHLSLHPVGSPGRQKTFAINSKRQIGKTTFAGNELLRFGLLLPGCESAYISPTFELAKKMLAEFSKTLSGTPLLESLNKTDRIVTLFNKHTFRLFSAEQGDNIRGFNVSGVLVLDEFAYMREAFLDEVVAPFTDFHKAPTITISTPRGKRGRHFENYTQGKSGNPMYQTFDWAEYDLSYMHSPEWLEEKRRTLPDRVFRTDYLGLFTDNEGAVFTNINAILLPTGYTPEMTGLSWGIDWAGGNGGDRTVLTAFNKKNEQAYLRAWHNEPPMQQVEEIAGVLNSHAAHTRSVVAEKNSMGAVYIDALRKQSKVGISDFVTSNESKRQIVESMIAMTEQKKVWLLPIEAQIAEFEYFESHTLPSGVIAYSAPAALHDDYVMASCIALSGRMTQNTIIIL